MVRQAVILAGGFGTRLGVLTKDIPKPMLPIGRYPFVDYLVTNLKYQGIHDIVFSTGYHADVIEAFYGAGVSQEVNITCVQEPEPLGTGGALKFIDSYLDSLFLVFNGDSLFDIYYLRFGISNNLLLSSFIGDAKGCRQRRRFCDDDQC